MEKQILTKLDELCNKQIEIMKSFIKEITDFRALPDITASLCALIEDYAKGLGCNDEDEIIDYVNNFYSELTNLFNNSFKEISPKKLIIGAVKEEDVDEVTSLIANINDDLAKAAFIAYTIDGIQGLRDFVKVMKPFENVSAEEFTNMLKFMSLLNGGLKN